VVVGAPVVTVSPAVPPARAKAGVVYVFYEKASGFATLDLANFVPSDSLGFIIQGAAVDDWLGWSVSGAGDVNGDGYADVIVGAKYADPNGRDLAGAAYVIFGKASRFATLDLLGFVSGDSTGFIIQGAAEDDYLGYSVSGAGDVNNDTYADVIVGAPRAAPYDRSFAGAAYVIFGKASGFVTLDIASFISGDSNGFIIIGAAAHDGLSESVSGAGINRRLYGIYGV
jgi:hypothetical protein